MSKKVSAFLASHGSIDAQYVSTHKDDKDVDIYDFEIGCRHLPANTRLYMPNILGKLYYANPHTTLSFIQHKIFQWSKRQQAASAAAPHSTHRGRSRSPEPSQSSFSDFIVEAITTFEEDETTAMCKLMDECDRQDLPGYIQGHKMSIEHKEQRRKLSKATTGKVGIKWPKLDCYIHEKYCNLTGKPGECILVVIEEIDSRGKRTIRKNIETIGSITGRMNLAGVEAALRSLKSLGLSATDEICFFDFACNTFNFLRAPPEIDKYWPNLLSYRDDGDSGATIIHGTVSKDQCERQKAAEFLGQNGVGFDESQKSVLTLDSQSQSSDSPDSQASVAASATPLLYVKVPKGAIPSIDFGGVVFGAGPASAAAFGGVVGSKQGGKRKHTKRKRSLKRSNRKRRVTRRRYNKKNR